MPEMKAGRKLDARLCELLEPMGAPPIRDVAALAWVIQSTSPLGFWKFFLGSDRRHPIPVSTDWGAMGKVAEKLIEMDIYLERLSYNPINKKWHARLYSWDGFNPLPSAYGSKGPHAFSLAACKALEGRAKAES